MNGWREVPAAPARTPHFHINLLPEARQMSTTRALMSAYLSYLYRCGEKRVYGQIVTFESRRGEKMFERYGFKVMNRAEITKYRAYYPESVYLSTVIKNLETGRTAIGLRRIRSESRLVAHGAARYRSGVSFAGIAQLVEQLICNQQVIGSSPIAGSIIKSVIIRLLFASPVVEIEGRRLFGAPLLSYLLAASRRTTTKSIRPGSVAENASAIVNLSPQVRARSRDATASPSDHRARHRRAQSCHLLTVVRSL